MSETYLEFSSLEYLDQYISDYEKKNCVQLWKRDSRTIEKMKAVCPVKLSSCNPELKYYRITYACKKGGRQFKSESSGLRKSSSYKDNCPMEIKVSLTQDGTKLKIVKICEEHNHTLDRAYKSVYGNHFTELSGDDEVRRKVRCEHCQRVITIGPGCTGNMAMARHLRSKHPAIVMMNQETEGMDVTETQTHTKVEYETEDRHKFRECYIMQSDDELEPEEKPKPSKQISRRKSQKNSFKIMSLIEPTLLRQEDSFDIFGKFVAMKMRGLDNHQRILAEKIIYNTLHEAEVSSWNQNNQTAVQTEENPLADEVTDGS